MKLSRRELLTTLVGAPVASTVASLPGCEKPAKKREVAGGFVGPSMKLGHRLRKPPPSDAEMGTAPLRMVDVVIVGGGPAGLSAARQLLRDGITNFALLELEPNLGGTSLGSESASQAYPWGAHYLTTPDPHNQDLITLLEEMGALEGKDETGHPIPSERHLVTEPKERLFYRGYWYEGLYPRQGATAEDLRQLEVFQRHITKLADVKDGRGRWAFALPLSSCSDDPDLTILDKTTASEWLDKLGLTSVRLRWYLEYACRDDYGLDLARTSAWALLLYFASRTERPGRPPAPVLTWPKGNAAIVQHLAKPIGKRHQTDALVVDVVPNEGGALVHVLADAGKRPQRLQAKRVILAVPKFVAARLLRPLREKRPAYLDRFEYGAWLTANLHLGGRPDYRGYAPSWDNVLYDSNSLGYVDASHQLGQAVGGSIWTYYMAMTDARASDGRKRLMEPSWDDYRDAITSDLRRAHPDLDLHLDRVDVCRWGHGMIQPRVGVVWSPELRAAREPHGPVHFAHTDLSGIGLFEEAFDHGMRAGREVVAVLRADAAG